MAKTANNAVNEAPFLGSLLYSVENAVWIYVFGIEQNYNEEKQQAEYGKYYMIFSNDDKFTEYAEDFDYLKDWVSHYTATNKLVHSIKLDLTKEEFIRGLSNGMLFEIKDRLEEQKDITGSICSMTSKQGK